MKRAFRNHGGLPWWHWRAHADRLKRKARIVSNAPFVIAGDSTAVVTINDFGSAKGINFASLSIASAGTGEKQAIIHVPAWAGQPAAQGDTVECRVRVQVVSGVIAWGGLDIYEQGASDNMLSNDFENFIFSGDLSVEHVHSRTFSNPACAKTSYALAIAINAPAAVRVNVHFGPLVEVN